MAAVIKAAVSNSLIRVAPIPKEAVAGCATSFSFFAAATQWLVPFYLQKRYGYFGQARAAAR